MDEIKTLDPTVARSQASIGSADVPMPPLRQAEVGLNNQLERVEALAAQLRDRLAPVLVDDGMVGSESVAHNPAPMGSPLAGTMRTWESRIDLVGDVLGRILGQLDLD